MRFTLLGILAILTGLGPGPLSAQAPGDTALAFTLKTLDGDAVSLSDFRGHPVVVNFWGTWCPPCRVELPLLAQAYRDHQAEGLVRAGAQRPGPGGLGPGGAQVRGGVRTAVPRPAGRTGEAMAALPRHRFPTMVFIGADGVVRAVVRGPTSEAALERHLAEILPVP